MWPKWEMIGEQVLGQESLFAVREFLAIHAAKLRSWYL